jgi:hypothetical protein
MYIPKRLCRALHFVTYPTACVAATLAASVASAQLSYHTVALTGQQAPGAAAGVSYGTLSLSPLSNDSQQVAYVGILTGPGIDSANDAAIYAGDIAGPQLVARAGAPAPGAGPDVTYSSLISATLADDGRVGFITDLAGPGVTFANSQAIYAGGIATGPQLLARRGDAAPGAGAGVTYANFNTASFRLSDTGQATYTAALSGAGVTSANDIAIYAGDLTAPQPVARAGDPAPGTAMDVTYGVLVENSLNDAQQVAYRTTLTGPGVTSANDIAIYAGSLAAPQLVARENSPAPGAPAGVRYFALADPPTLNDGGHVGFVAQLVGTGVTAGNNYAIFAGSAASPQLVAREGSGYSEFSRDRVALNDTGQIAFATVGGGGSSGFAIYAGDYASPRLIAHAGDHAPGTPANVNYAFGGDFDLNDAGQLVYSFFLLGDSVTSANDQALFAFDPVLGNMLIAREGDPFDVGGGELRTIAGAIGFRFGSSDDLATGLANDGTVAFRLTFTDGSSGIFTTRVPEPVAFAPLTVIALTLLGLGWRGRK